jgi:hypothetical protein
MNHPSAILEKSFEPGLFRLAAFANDIKSVNAHEKVLALSRAFQDKMMFDPRKLEAMLRGFSGKKKSARHASATTLLGV